MFSPAKKRGAERPYYTTSQVQFFGFESWLPPNSLGLSSFFVTLIVFIVQKNWNGVPVHQLEQVSFCPPFPPICLG